MDHPEFRSELVGDGVGEFGVDVGTAAQAVVDVDGGDVATRCDRKGDQRGGISTSGQPARDGGAVRREGAPVEKVGGVEQGGASVSDR